MSCNIAMRMYQQKGKYCKTGVHRKNCGNKPAIEIKKDSRYLRTERHACNRSLQNVDTHGLYKRMHKDCSSNNSKIGCNSRLRFPLLTRKHSLLRLQFTKSHKPVSLVIRLETFCLICIKFPTLSG